jgi:Predicted dehydrogenases and related proteins
MRRYDAGYRAMKAALEDGGLGAPLLMHCAHRNPSVPDYGFTTDMIISDSAVHEIDIVRWLFGEEIVAASVLTPRRSGHAPEGLQDPLILVLETASGALVDDELFVSARYGYDVRGEVVCETGTVALADVSEVTVRTQNRHSGRVPVDWRGPVHPRLRHRTAGMAQRWWRRAPPPARPPGTASPPPWSRTPPSRRSAPASAPRFPCPNAGVLRQMKIALDPYMFRRVPLTDLPGLVADLGYEYIELSPREDFMPFFLHPRADRAQIAAFSRALNAAGVQIATVLPLYRWSGPDEDERQAAVRYWKRAIQITVDLGVNVMNSEFNGRPEAAAASEAQFWRSLEDSCRLRAGRRPAWCSNRIRTTSSRTAGRPSTSSAASTRTGSRSCTARRTPFTRAATSRAS